MPLFQIFNDFRMVLMEINLSAEKEARLQLLAGRSGKKTDQVVEEAVDRFLEYEEQFAAAVDKGRDSARRGDLLEHDQVVDRIERILHS